MPIADKSLLLAKLEAAYGTYLAPAPATDMSPVFDYSMTPMESEEFRRQIERGFHGINPASPTAIRQRHSFKTELAGAGTVDGVPHWAKLLRACQFDAPVITAGVMATHPLIGVGDGASLSIAGNKGGAFDLRGRGARGNCTLSFTEKQQPHIAWDMVALLQDDVNIVTANAPVGIVMPTDVVPAEVSMLNTVVQLDGVALGVRSLELNLGAKVEYFSTTGSRQVVFGKDESGSARAPAARCVFEMPDIGVKNYFPQIRAGTAVAFSLVHGTAAGNIIEITAANAVLGRAEFQVEANRIFLSADIQFVATAAGNDFTLITR